MNKHFLHAEKRILRPHVEKSKILKRFLLGIAIASLLSPVALSRVLSKPIKGSLLAISLSSCIGALLVNESEGKAADLLERIQSSQNKALLENWGDRAKRRAIQKTISDDYEAYTSITKAEKEESGRSYWANMFGLHLPGLKTASVEQPATCFVEPVEQDCQGCEEEEAGQEYSSPVRSRVQFQQQIGQIVQERETLERNQDPRLDTTWFFDPEFIRSSKAVFGAKGSGKSVAMAYIANRFLADNPEGNLYVIDPHYNHKAQKWLPGLPEKEVRSRYLVDDFDGAFQVLAIAQSELDKRISDRDESAPPFLLVIDEFSAVLMWIEEYAASVTPKRKEQEDIKQEYANRLKLLIAKSQNQGRKYNFNIVLLLHTIKKSETMGILDSGYLAQMNMLVLGESINDITIAWPSSFDLKALAQERYELEDAIAETQKQVQAKIGRACIARIDGGKPKAYLIPNLTLSSYQLSFEIGADGQLQVFQQPQGSKGSKEKERECPVERSEQTKHSAPNSSLHALERMVTPRTWMDELQEWAIAFFLAEHGYPGDKIVLNALKALSGRPDFPCKSDNIEEQALAIAQTHIKQWIDEYKAGKG